MASKEVEYQQARPKRTGIAGAWDSFSLFIWDPVNKTFIGRGCTSWAKIGVFYLIYYSCLAAFFAIALMVFFQTLDDVEPAQMGMQSILKGNPGMGFRPRPKVESTLVKFTQGQEDTYSPLIEHIQEFIDTYNVSNRKESNLVDCDTVVPEEGQACLFDPEKEAGECTKENNYGYDEGQPCVLLKLNRIYGWVPEPFDEESINADNDHAKKAKKELGDLYNKDYIGITCEGENDGDNDNRGPVKLFPKYGFPLKGYFPYKNQKDYQTPFVFVKFTKPRQGALIQMWCKAWAKNIYHHKNDKAGSIHLELLVD